MTTEPKGLTDAECRRIRERILMSINELRSHYLDRVIRAAYAAGAASVPREPTQAMTRAGVMANYSFARPDVMPIEQRANAVWRAMYDAAQEVGK